MASRKNGGLGAKVRFVVDLAASGNVTPAGAVKALRDQYPENKISYLRTVVYGHARKAGARFVEAETAGRTGPAPPREVTPRQLAVTAGGQCVIPREMRAAMRLQPGDRVIARVEAGELRLTAPAVVVEQVQARMRKYGQPDGAVDRFLAERCALWDGT